MTNSTRPSGVSGMSSASSPGRNDRSRTTWLPRLTARSGAAGEKVVRLQPDRVLRQFPPRIAGEDEREVADEVRGVPAEPAAFPQGVEDEPDPPLPEIADAAVDEFRAAARRARPEVAAFEK